MNPSQRVSESVAMARRLLNGESYKAVGKDSGLSLLQCRHQTLSILSVAGGTLPIKRGRIDDYRADTGLWNKRLDLVESHSKAMSHGGMRELTAELGL